MPSSAEKLGLWLTPGLHQDMVRTAQRLSTRKNPRGDIRRIYERAFREIIRELESGHAIPFPAVRGAKDRVSLRLSPTLCARIRRHVAEQNLKLTDFAFAAVDRLLKTTEGNRHAAARQARARTR